MKTTLENNTLPLYLEGRIDSNNAPEGTDFTELFDVKKRIREISIEGAELIGKGTNGAIYRLDKETIVKVYYDVSNPLEKIERDRAVS